jgi:hypothetical protein
VVRIKSQDDIDGPNFAKLSRPNFAEFSRPNSPAKNTYYKEEHRWLR